MRIYLIEQIESPRLQQELRTVMKGSRRLRKDFRRRMTRQLKLRKLPRCRPTRFRRLRDGSLRPMKRLRRMAIGLQTVLKQPRTMRRGLRRLSRHSRRTQRRLHTPRELPPQITEAHRRTSELAAHFGRTSSASAHTSTRKDKVFPKVYKDFWRTFRRAHNIFVSEARICRIGFARSDTLRAGSSGLPYASDNRSAR